MVRICRYEVRRNRTTKKTTKTAAAGRRVMKVLARGSNKARKDGYGDLVELIRVCGDKRTRLSACRFNFKTGSMLCRNR